MTTGNKPPAGKRQGWLDAYASGLSSGSLRQLIENLRLWAVPTTRAQDVVKKTYLNHSNGPMFWLGEQIVKRMEKAGYPSRIFCCYRNPDEQDRLFARGRSKARAFQSPHQYYEAVDIIHKTKAWDVDQEYWDTLAAVVRVVAREYKVDLEHGYDWGWDSAHIEIKHWRDVRHAQAINGGPWRVPTPQELDARFKELLPAVWRQLVGAATASDEVQLARTEAAIDAYISARDARK